MSKKMKKRKKDRADTFLFFANTAEAEEKLITALRATADWRYYDLPSRWTRVK